MVIFRLFFQSVLKKKKKLIDISKNDVLRVPTGQKSKTDGRTRVYIEGIKSSGRQSDYTKDKRKISFRSESKPMEKKSNVIIVTKRK